MQFDLKRGLDLYVPNPPESTILDGPPVRTVALLGRDYGAVRPSMKVKIGDSVKRGQVLFTDRAQPEISFTAPASGTVLTIERGEHRRFVSVQIAVNGDDAMQFTVPNNAPTQAQARDLLLASGLWTALRSRPFGRTPAADADVPNIFVTAMDSNPLAADPAVVIERDREKFHDGVRWLTRLTDGQVFVCQRAGPALAGGSIARAVTAVFNGPHPAGLAGTHIHHIRPVSRRRSAWQIGYQDVIGLGHLVQTGELSDERIISIAGPGVTRAALYRTKPGARLTELTGPLLNPAPLPDQEWRVVAGSPLTGNDPMFLGRFCNQVSVLGARNRVQVRGQGHRIWQRNHDSARHANTVLPIIPYAAIDRVLPFDIYAVPLLRALSAGDVEAADRLGCLELIEEDVELLSYLCTSNADYGQLLRDTLTELQAS